MNRRDIKIVADDKIPFLRGVLEPFVREVVYLPGAKTTPADVRDAQAVITRTRTKCAAALLDGSAVELVATATIGFDHFDTAYLERRGIAWYNAPGCNSESVKQYITSALVNLGIELAGKTLGVIGVGNVGSKVARAGEALGMRVLRNDPPRAASEGADGFVSLERILAESDVVTMHVPLENGGRYPTFHLAGAEFFEKMRRGAHFINSSRGEVCDNAALKAALKAGTIAGAVLDVWENEPEFDLELLPLLRFATPHIAGYSANGKANGTAHCVRLIAGRFGIDELKNWFPADFPKPENPYLEPELLRDIVNASYDIRRDDADLRRAPGDFEKLRGDYYCRLEFSSYVTGHETAVKLGFRQK